VHSPAFSYIIAALRLSDSRVREIINKRLAGRLTRLLTVLVGDGPPGSIKLAGRTDSSGPNTRLSAPPGPYVWLAAWHKKRSRL